MILHKYGQRLISQMILNSVRLPINTTPACPPPQLSYPQVHHFPSSPQGQLLMDPESLQLGTENLWAWLVRLLSENSAWLDAQVRFYLPTVDLDSSSKVPDPEIIRHQLRRLYTQGLETWQSFIYSLCMELTVPLDLEVPLLSIWGQKDGKGPHGRYEAASTAF